MISDQQREDNFQEYLRLLKDPNYCDVTFDERSGGISAIHKEHYFDKSVGPFGVQKGEYERITVDTLRERGHLVYLESEKAPDGVKTPDGIIDGQVMEIKAIEGTGRWAIKDKLHAATKQKAECVVLYFHKKELYSYDRIADGWDRFLRDDSSQKYPACIKRVLCVVEGKIVEFEEV